jgi:hypothetical protein
MNLPGQQWPQPLLFLLSRTIPDQHFHVARIRRGAIARLGGNWRPPHDLAKRRILQVGQPRAVFAFRQEQVPQPGSAGLRLEVLHDGRNLPAIGFKLFEIRCFAGIDVFVHEGGEPRLQFRRPLGLLEHESVLSG